MAACRRMTGSFEEDVVLRGSWDARNGWLGGTTSMVAKGSLLDNDSIALDVAFNDLTRMEDVAISLTRQALKHPSRTTSIRHHGPLF